MTITYIFLGIMVLCSMMAESNPQLKQKWMMNPYHAHHNKQYYRFLTSGFIHGGYLHLAFNAIGMYYFGGAIEQIFNSPYIFGDSGTLYFCILFIIGIIISSIPSYIKYKNNIHYNALGASGGVSALVFAFILFLPTQMLSFIFIPFIEIPGFILGAFYLIYSYYQAKNGNDNIGHEAHLAGAIFGLVFCIVLQPTVVPRFFEQIASFSFF